MTKTFEGLTPCEKLTLGELIPMRVGSASPSPRPRGRTSVNSPTPLQGDGGYLLDDDWRARYPGEPGRPRRGVA